MRVGPSDSLVSVSPSTCPSDALVTSSHSHKLSMRVSDSFVSVLFRTHGHVPSIVDLEDKARVRVSDSLVSVCLAHCDALVTLNHGHVLQAPGAQR